MTDPYRPELLPAAIVGYLEGHGDVPDRAAAAAVFAEDAVVVDDGSSYTGIAEIRDWIGRAATEYRYTTEHLGQERLGAAEWLVVDHLEGDFPGGVVDLRLRFVLDGDRIRSLVIAP